MKLDPKKLGVLVDQSDKRIQPFRETRKKLAREIAGPYYGHQGKDAAQSVGPQPIASLFSAASALLPSLVMQTPQAQIRAKQEELEAQAAQLGAAWDLLAHEINLGDSLRMVALEALCGPAVCVIGVCDASHEGTDPGGYLHDPQQVYVDPIDLDDYVCDMSARRREAMMYEGHRYVIRRDIAEGLYGKKQIDRLAEQQASRRERAGDLTTGQNQSGDEDRDTLELCQLWLPQERKLVVMPGSPDAGWTEFLAEVPWEGPERGPYEMLGFHWTPGNPMPVGLMTVLLDLHYGINKQARKLGRQADRQKDLLLYDKAVGEEVETVRDSSDGDMVGVQNTDRYTTVSFGGAAKEGYEYLMHLLQQQSRVGGNLDLVGGAQAQSGTLGQDQLLYAQASARIDDMRTQFLQFTRRVGTRMAWYIWHDEMRNPTVKVRGEDGVPIEMVFDQTQRQGDFFDLDFDVEPYSLSPDNPEKAFQRTMIYLEKIVVPTQQAAMAQGMELDVMELAKISSKLLHMPELAKLYRAAAPMQVPGAMPQGGGLEMADPNMPTTTRGRMPRMQETGV